MKLFEIIRKPPTGVGASTADGIDTGATRLLVVRQELPNGDSAIIADGILFPCGKAAVCSRLDGHLVNVYDNVRDMRAVHNVGDTFIDMSHEIGFEDWPL